MEKLIVLDQGPARLRLKSRSKLVMSIKENGAPAVFAYFAPVIYARYVCLGNEIERVARVSNHYSEASLGVYSIILCKLIL